MCEDLKKEPSNDEGKNELLSTKIECRKLSDIQNIFDIQVNDPSSKTDPYMRGMANGMIMLKSILDGCEPKFIDKPSLEKQAEPVNCKTICDACGEYDYDCTCKQPAKVEQTISISREVAEEWLKEEIYMNEHNEGMLSELRTALAQEKGGKND